MHKKCERAIVTNASPESERKPDKRVSRITGFHQDEDGHWVVDLSCGHTQHLRHQPPWQSRAWVLDAAERERRIGQAFACGWCAQGHDSDTLGN